MKLLTPIFVLCLLLTLQARAADWEPAGAVAAAEADLTAGRIAFYFVGGFVPTAPGVAQSDDHFTAIYPHRLAGDQTCAEGSQAQVEYARRYNERVVAYLRRR